MNLSRFSSLKNYTGNDVNLETSLYEYGLIWKKVRGAKDEYHFIYGMGKGDNGDYNLFGHGYMSFKDFREMTGESWFDLPAVLSFIGRKSLEFPNDLDGVIAYYGTENVFGTDYYPIKIIKRG